MNHRGGSLNRGDNNRASQSPQTYNHVPGNTSPLRHRSRGADSNDQRVSGHQIAVGGGDLSQGADQQSSLNVSQVHPQNLNSNNLRMRDGSNSAAIRSPANEARSIPRVGDSITKQASDSRQRSPYTSVPSKGLTRNASEHQPIGLAAPGSNFEKLFQMQLDEKEGVIR